MNVRLLALDIGRAVEPFIEKAKRFFYGVMLFGHRCPECNGTLVMEAEGRCRCTTCSKALDPTVSFQRCPECGGRPVLRVRRYQCQNCSKDVKSRFLFDGLVFDPEYFRQKMIESRKRKQARVEQVRKLLAETRSNILTLSPVELGAFPDLVEALNSLAADPQVSVEVESKDGFDLHRYEAHIQAYIQDFPVNLADIPPLSNNPRKDLIRRFIAVIFLAHVGSVEVCQEEQGIMVMKHETNREGQDVLGESENLNGIEGSVGGAQTW